MKKAAVVYFSPEIDKSVKFLAESLAAGIRSQGIEVECLNGEDSVGKKLNVTYLAIGCVPLYGMGVGITGKVKMFLEQAGVVSGKRSYAFVCSRGIRKQRNLHKLMSVMESEGLYIKRSDVLKSSSHAESVGAELRI